MANLLDSSSSFRNSEVFESNTEIENPDQLSFLNAISFTPECLIEKSDKCDYVMSTGGSPKIWFPECCDDKKPFIGMSFPTLAAGIQFYENYAKLCGFSVRLSTQKTKRNIVVFKRLLCSREGVRDVQKPTGNVDKKRNRSQTRLGCKALMTLTLSKNGLYVVSKFREGHEHVLVSPESRHLINRDMNIGLQYVVASNLRVNKGPNVSFRSTKELVGGYDKIGASLVDFKNYSRDLKLYIGENDAQMFVDIMDRRKQVCPSFFFEHSVDDENHLIRAFWADPIGQRNYVLFGDAVSFDTTYNTNKYCLVFCPFTGIDHHNRCVTFGAGLIYKEDIESFSWLFQAFLSSMGGHQPITIITDQDPAMKVAINRVFDKSVHKHCMWHITKKFKDKIPTKIFDDPDFKKELNSIIWNHDIEPAEFEMRWDSIMAKNGLSQDDQIRQLFAMREMWIPAYFRGLFLGGLMRTTSRSESENNFFNQFTNPYIGLVELWARFESAMDAQRYSQSTLNKDSKHSCPVLKSPLDIEMHASQVYTHTIFYEVQVDIWYAIFNCVVQELKTVDGVDSICLNDTIKKKSYILTFNRVNGESTCECKHFERKGLPCKHLLWLFKERGFKEIPSSYIVNRWTKEAHKKPVFDMSGNLLENIVLVDETRRLVGEQWIEFLSCVDVAFGYKDHMKDLVTCLKDFKDSTLNKIEELGKKSKSSVIEVLVGANKPEEIIVKNPKKCKNKGSGKRLKSAKEISMDKQKTWRLCRSCGQFGYHDSRNCPKNASSKC